MSLNFTNFIKWHRGRVARQSSAKAFTAVRIRSMPLPLILSGGGYLFISKILPPIAFLVIILIGLP